MKILTICAMSKKAHAHSPQLSFFLSEPTLGCVRQFVNEFATELLIYPNGLCEENEQCIFLILKGHYYNCSLKYSPMEVLRKMNRLFSHS